MMLYHQIKIHDGWVAKVEFLHEISPEQAHLAKSTIQPKQKDINILHADLGYPLQVITHATGRAIGLHLTGPFK